jgi:hypothetical protein
MTRYAKRKLKYSLNENFNLLPYVEWDRTGAQAEWGLRYRIYRLPCDLNVVYGQHHMSSPLVYKPVVNSGDVGHNDDSICKIILLI